MALKAQILEDMKSAMRAKEQVKLETIRMLQSAIKLLEIELRPNEITEPEVLGVVKKLIKQRKDSFEQYQAAARPELAEKEALEITFLEKYLPPQLSEAQVAEVVAKAITSTGATSAKDMGKVMKEVLAQIDGQADSKLISQLVKAKLS